MNVMPEVSADHVENPLPVLVALIDVAPALLVVKVEPVVQNPEAFPVICTLIDSAETPAPSEAVPVTAASAERNCAAVGEVTVAVGALVSKVNCRVAALVLLVPDGDAESVVVTVMV